MGRPGWCSTVVGAAGWLLTRGRRIGPTATLLANYELTTTSSLRQKILKALYTIPGVLGVVAAPVGGEGLTPGIV